MQGMHPYNHRERTAYVNQRRISLLISLTAIDSVTQVGQKSRGQCDANRQRRVMLSSIAAAVARRRIGTSQQSAHAYAVIITRPATNQIAAHMNDNYCKHDQFALHS